MFQIKCDICGKPYQKRGWLWRHKRKFGHLNEVEKLGEATRLFYSKTFLKRAIITLKGMKSIKVGEGRVIRFHRY